MPSILLVDDDEDSWEAVRIALEALVSVSVVGTRHEALNILKKHRPNGLCGVIVDLNLTSQDDNLGRDLLENLREMEIPCVVFSGTVKSSADGERYRNEFGVLGTVGKKGV